MRRGEPPNNQKHPDPRGDRLEPGASIAERVKRRILCICYQNALTEFFGLDVVSTLAEIGSSRVVATGDKLLTGTISPVGSLELEGHSCRPRCSPYVQQVSLFARHFGKSPEVLGPEEIPALTTILPDKRKEAGYRVPSSISPSIRPASSFYKVTLHRDWCLEDIIPAPKKPQKLTGGLESLPDPLCIDRNGWS